VQRLSQSYLMRVLIPIEQLGLKPEAVVDPPAGERVAIRVRFAGHHQLGAHTPRPRALAGSLASAQIHESLVNNVLEQLNLNGRTMTVGEVFQSIGAKLNMDLKMKASDEDREDSRGNADSNKSNKADRLHLTFAGQDAIRVRMQDGKIQLILTLAKLKGGKREWRDIQILASYSLRPAEATVELVQQGDISLIGRISIGSQIIVRGILSNFFEKDRSVRLWEDAMSAQWEENLAVTQSVVTDGWIGISLGEKKSSSEQSRRKLTRQLQSLKSNLTNSSSLNKL